MRRAEILAVYDLREPDDGVERGFDLVDRLAQRLRVGAARTRGPSGVLARRVANHAQLTSLTRFGPLEQWIIHRLVEPFDAIARARLGDVPSAHGMLLKRFYDTKLAQASYLVGCQRTGEALVIDSNRDVDQYVRGAEAEGLRIAHVTETHIHADFVSGSREVAERTGAQLYLSDEGDADWKYVFARVAGAQLLRDGDVINVGKVTLRVLHTPGHTPEHISFLLTDRATSDRPMGVFTGDFVFM